MPNRTLTGKATGGSTTQLIDAGQSWTVNNLRGKILYIAATGDYCIIRDNTATTIDIVGIAGATLNGKSYVIQDWSTIFNTSQPNTPYGAVVGVVNNVGARNNMLFNRFKVIGSAGVTYSCLLYNSGTPKCTYISVDGNSLGSGALGVYNCPNMWLESIVATNSSMGICIIRCGEVQSSKNLFAYSNSSNGLDIEGYLFTYTLSYVYSDNNGGSGIRILDCCGSINFGSYVGMSTNAGPGIQIQGAYKVYGTTMVIDSCSIGIAVNITGTIGAFTGWNAATCLDFTGNAVTLTNNTNGGIVVGANAIVRLTTCAGTGNGGYGITCSQGGKVFITSATSVTGATNNINLGGVAKTYAGDFAADNSYAVDASTQSLIKRTDSGAF